MIRCDIIRDATEVAQSVDQTVGQHAVAVAELPQASDVAPQMSDHAVQPVISCGEVVVGLVPSELAKFAGSLLAASLTASVIPIADGIIKALCPSKAVIQRVRASGNLSARHIRPAGGPALAS
jgi:hypothetical protein